MGSQFFWNFVPTYVVGTVLAVAFGDRPLARKYLANGGRAWLSLAVTDRWRIRLAVWRGRVVGDSYLSALAGEWAGMRARLCSDARRWRRERLAAGVLLLLALGFAIAGGGPAFFVPLVVIACARSYVELTRSTLLARYQQAEVRNAAPGELAGATLSSERA